MPLCLRNLVKTFPGGVRAVDDLSLEVAASELLVLMGPSGCGKTTTLRMIAGLERPTSGSIALAGRVLDGVAPRSATSLWSFSTVPCIRICRSMPTWPSA